MWINTHKMPGKVMLVLLAILSTFLLIPATPSYAQCTPVKIMPLGDSLTSGYGETTTYPLMVGYRQALLNRLTSTGYVVDFVGSQIAGDGIPGFDANHEGHGGWTSAQVAGNVYQFLVDNPADIVLLHIGTNGLVTNVTEVQNILNEIDRYESTYSRNVKVILAQIINHQTYDANTSAFNANLYTLAMSRKAAGDLLWLVDMEHALSYPGDLYDELHPNTSGYGKMADTWFYAIGELMTACSGTGNEAPNGSIVLPAGNITIQTGQSVSFAGSYSDPDGDLPLSYLWNFGGSGVADSTVEDPGLVAFNVPGTYTVTFTVTDSTGLADPTPATRTVKVISNSSTISKSGWTLKYADSEQTASYPATYAFDGKTTTFWHTQYSPTSPGYPHEIQIYVGGLYDINGFSYLPRQDGGVNGRIAGYEFYVSADGEDWGTAVASGTFANTSAEKTVSFTPKAGQFIRLKALSEVAGNPWATMAEISVSGTVSGSGWAPNGTIDSPSGDVTIQVGQSVSFAGTGSDPDGNLPLAYLWNFGGSGVPDATVEDPGSMTFNTPGVYTVTLNVTDALGLADLTPATRVITVTSNSSQIPQTGWTLKYVDSESTSYPAANSFDGNVNTMWHTRWDISSPYPHEIQINLGQSYSIDRFRYLPRQDGGVNGRIAGYEFYVSTDGNAWGTAVATGTFANTAAEKEVSFTPKTGQFIRLKALSEVSGNPFASMAEINVFGSVFTPAGAPNGTIDNPSENVTIGVGQSVIFSGTGSDPDGNLPLTYLWNFGGSGVPDATVEDPGSVIYNTAGAYTVTFTVTDSTGLSDPTPASRTITVVSNSSLIPRTGWTLKYVDSEVAGYLATNTFDGNVNTMWHTAWDVYTPYPHEIQINLGQLYDLEKFLYLPRQDGGVNGRIAQYEFYVSTDGENWGTPVATGTFANTAAEKEVSFSPKTGQFIRLKALSEVGGSSFASMAEINVVGSIPALSGTPNGTIDSPSGNVTIMKGESVSFAGTGSDSDGNLPLAYLWTFGGSGTADMTVEDPGAVTFNTLGTYTVTFTVTDSTGLVDPTPATRTVTVTSNSQVISQTGWSLKYVDSQEIIDGFPATNSFDGNVNTMWHTQFSGGSPIYPHEIQINLGQRYDLEKFRYLPRQDGGVNGRIAQYEFYVSEDGENWGTPVASGTFENTAAEKEVSFSPKTGQYIRLKGLSEVYGNPWAAMAEINVVGAVATVSGAPNGLIDSPAGNVSIMVGQSVSFAGTGSDPDGNLPLTYLWQFGGSGVPNSTVEDPGSLTFNAPGTYTVTFTVTDSSGIVDPTPATRVVTVGINSALISKTGWTLKYVDSEEPVAFPATNTFDGSINTFWHTQFEPVSTDYPHEIQINLGKLHDLDRFRYQSRQDGVINGRIAQYEFYVSVDGENWGTPVATGTFANSAAEQEVSFVPKTGQYIRLRALSEVAGNPWAAVAEINVLGAVSSANIPPNGTIDSPLGDVTIQVGQSVAFTGTGSDMDGNVPLTYLWQYGGSGVPNAVVDDPGSVAFNVPGVYTVTFTVTDSTGLADPTPATRVITVTSNAPVIPRTGWTLQYVDSENTADYSGYPDGLAVYSFDGNVNTFWHTQYMGAEPGYPHDIQINLGQPHTIEGFRYMPRQDGVINGRVAQYEFYVSADGANWGPAVATGTFANSGTEKIVPFAPKTGQYIRLKPLTEVNGYPWAAMAEINILGVAPGTPRAIIDSPAGDMTIQAGQSVSFAGTGSDPDGDPNLQYLWKFGGSGIADSTLEDPGSVQFNTPGTYIVTFAVTDSTGLSYPTPATRVITVRSNTPAIPHTLWTLKYVDSEELAVPNRTAVLSFDGDITTFWQTKFIGGTPGYPHEIQINLGRPYAIDGFRYLPRQDGSSDGRIAQYEFYVSLDGNTWGPAAAIGTFTNSDVEKEVIFAPKTGQFIRLVALSEVNGNPTASMAEIHILGNAANLVPEIISTPVTSVLMGRTYVYDVNAVGFPEPTFSASGLPPGSIDATSGLIEWTPTAAGYYPVTVTASNIGGTDTQTFAIDVFTPPATCPPDMTHYWRLDESSGPYADTYGGSTASCVSSNCPTAAEGKVNGAQSFPGNSQVNVEYDGTFDWSAASSFSVEAWIKTVPGSTCAGNQVFIGRQSTSTNLHWFVGCLEGGHAAFNLIGKSGDTAGLLTSTTAVNDGNWHHIVAVRDAGSANDVRLYVDGVKEAFRPGNYTSGFDEAGIDLNIGHLTASYSFAGDLDEIAMYDRALSDAEIQQHFGMNNYTVDHHWSLDETDAPFADSFGGPSIECNSGDCPEYTIGKVNGAREFTTATQLNIPNSSIFDWNASASFSIEAWIKTDPGDTCAGNQVVIGRQGASTNLHWFVGCLEGGHAGFNLIGKNGETAGLLSGTSAIGDGNWHHVVAVLDAGPANVIKLYVDGVKEASAPGNYTSGFDEAGIPVNIGHLIEAYHFTGALDELSVYNRALSDGEVRHRFEDRDYGYCDALVAVTTNAAGTGSGSVVSSPGGIDFQYPSVSRQTTSSMENGTAFTVTATADNTTSTVSWSNCEAAGGVVSGNTAVATCTLPSVIESKSITAVFALKQYTVTAIAGANGSLSGATPSPAMVDHGSNAHFTFNANVGYHVASVSDTCGGTPHTNTLNSESTYAHTSGTIIANGCVVNGAFAINRYTLTYNAGSNGSISGSSSQNVNYGGSGTAVAAVPATGYHFVEWSDGSTLNPRTDSSVAADISVTASFAINTYTLTYNAGINGSLQGSATQTGVIYGTSGTAVTAVPAAGYHFVEWSDGSTANPRTDSNVTANINVTAIFAINVYTVTSAGGANGSITPASQPVDHGNTAQFLVEPAAGYLAVMSGTCGGTLAGNIYTTSPITGSCNVAATFVLPAAPQITSVPVTTAVVGQAYTYAVTATGSPNPTISLGSTPAPPAGMQVEPGATPGTATITWTPSVPVQYEYTISVVAANGVNPDATQAFNLRMLDGPSNMSHYWRLNEGSGATSFDDYYGTNDATCSAGSCPTSATGKVNGAQQFDAVSMVAASDDGTLEWGSGQSFSIEFWMKTDAGSTCLGDHVIVGRDDATTPMTWWVGCKSTSAKAAFYVYDNNNISASALGTTALNDTNWHHVAAVRDASQNKLLLYVDGALQTSSSSPAFTGGFESSAPLHIGHLVNRYHFRGAIDEVAVYDKALSADEIGRHYYHGSNGYGYADAVSKVTSQAGSNGSIAPSGSQSVKNGNTAQFTVSPATGFYAAVTGCGGTLVGNAYTTGSVMGDCTVSATFSSNQYQVSATAGTHGNVAAPSSVTVNHGSTAQFTFSAVTGYHVAAVSGCGISYTNTLNSVSSYLATTAPVTGACTVNATFAINQYQVTANATANGTRDPGYPAVQIVDYGGNTWIGFLANNGYHVATVSGCNGTTFNNTDNSVDTYNYRTGAVTSNCSVTATFEINKYQVTATAGSGGSLNAATPSPVVVNHSSTAQFRFDALAGYRISSIADGCGGPGFANSDPSVVSKTYTTGIVTSACAVNATFQANVSPVITSQASTWIPAGGSYSYDVNATGSPAPTFSLSVNPGGMTIDPATGLINWVAPTPGNYDYPVTVAAANGVGSNATQSFRIRALQYPATMSHYWNLDEGAGATQFLDYKANQNAYCSGINCPAPATGAVNGAQQFTDGLTPSRVNVESGGSFEWAADASFSIEAWVKLDSGNSCFGDQSIIGRAGTSSGLYWFVGCQDDGNLPVFYLQDRNGNPAAIAGASPITDANWHHLVAVRDAAENRLKLYVDGTAQPNPPDTSSTYDSSGFWGTESLTIGWLDDMAGHNFEGIIDEVALYNGVLSPEDIQKHYRHGVNGYGPADAVSIVTPQATAHGSISPASPQAVVTYGGTVAFTVTPENSGYHATVTGCGGSLVGNTYTTGPVTADCTVTANFTMGEDPVITWSNPTPIAYGAALSGTQLNATASVPGTFVYTPAAGTVLNAGNGQILRVDFTPTDTIHYNTASKTVLINVAQRGITVTADAKSKGYGQTDPALTYQITSGSLVGGDAFTGSLSRTAGENVGAYPINQGTLTAGANYNLSYVGANLTIDQRNITVTADAKSKGYGDADPALTYQITSGSLVSGDAFTGSLSRTAGENVGAYPINQGTLTAGGNYNLSYVGANLTIGQRNITVTADAKSKAYGNADPALTYQITSGSLVSGDAFTGSLSRTAGENVGAYPINQGTLTAGGNYNLSYVGANLTIGQRSITVTADAKSKAYGDADPALTHQVTSGSLVGGDSITGSLSRTTGEAVGAYPINQGTLTAGSNYNMTYAGANFTIGQRNITVTADAKTKVYGNADPALTYQITSGSLVNGDTITGSLARTAGETVGAYPINRGTLTAGSNYNMTYAGANLSITQRAITVTADAKSKVYGNADPALTYQITSGSLVNGDAITGSLSRTAGEAVGAYPINQGTLTAGGNYNLGFVGANLTISQRSITITADAKSKVYGNADPALTYQITGGSLVNGDAITGSLSRTAGEAVGAYPINQGTLTAGGNYNLGFVGANLTISQRSITVTADAKSKAYGTADPVLTYQVTTGSLMSGDAFTGSLSRTPGESVGTYPINQGTLSAGGNYNMAYVGANLTIADGAAPVVTISNGPVSPTKATSAQFVFSATDDLTPPAGIVLECRLDGAGFAPCVSPVSYTGLAEGNHVFAVRATDDVGNVSEIKTWSWAVDQTAPLLTMTSMPFDPSNTADPLFKFTSSEPSVFTCQMDGGTPEACDPDPSDPGNLLKGSKQYTGLTAGFHSFVLTAVDGAGNTYAISFEWEIDLSLPGMTIDSSPLDPSDTNSAPFTFHSVESSTFSCKLEKNGAVIDATACVPDPAYPDTKGSKEYSGLGEGNYKFTVTATDWAGNVSTDSFEWRVDLMPPVVTIESMVPNPTSGGTTVTWRSTESGTFNVTVEGTGVANGNYTTPAQVNTDILGGSFVEGNNQIMVCVTDQVGHQGCDTESLVKDTTAPVLSLPSDFSAEATSIAGAVVTFTATANDVVDGPVAVACAPVSGSTFPLGETTVNCSSSDSLGHTANGNFKVTVVDTTAPVVTVPSNITREATGPGGAVVTFTVTASDLVDGARTPACAPPSGSTFPIGITTVNCSAADTRGNTGNGSFTVTVRDTTAPDVTVPSNIMTEATGPGGAVVTFTATASDIVAGVLTPTCIPASGSAFALGTTQVNCSATDGYGNTGNRSFTVTVMDTTRPVVTVPANIVTEATGSAGAVVTFTATAADIVDGALTPTCIPASGSTFAIGATTVNCSATDGHGNTGNNSFTVTVEDHTAPVVTVPENIVREAAGPSGAVVTFTVTAYDLFDGARPVTCAPASGSTFPITTTTVNCSATDGHGNTGNGSFTVTVQDTTPPTVTSSNMTVEATGPAGAAVTFTVTASDIVDGARTPSCTPASGSTFPIATTTVNCSATDTRGNTGNGSFTVTVVDTTSPSSTITFPADGYWYNESLWDAGCGGGGGDVCGNANDTGAGLQEVRISIRQVSSGLYWGGSAFDSATEFLFSATGLGSWVSAFGIGSFPADGDYTIHSKAKDLQGNAEAGDTVTFTIDRNGPVVSLLTPQDGSSTNDSTPTFSGVGGLAEEDLAAITVNIYNSELTLVQTRPTTRNGSTGEYSVDASPALADGTYVALAEQQDGVGNTGFSSPNTFTIDTVAPTAAITFPANGVSYSQSAWNAGCGTSGVGDLCGTASQTGAPIQKVELSICQTGGLCWNSSTGLFDSAGEIFYQASGTSIWTYGFAFSQFANGSYTVHVKATDTLGNVEAGTTRTFVIDGTAPETSFTGALPLNPTTSKRATFNFISSETGSTFECRLDGGAWGSCVSPKTYGISPDPLLTTGSHTFDVRATDTAGNVDPTPATFTWIIQ